MPKADTKVKLGPCLGVDLTFLEWTKQAKQTLLNIREHRTLVGQTLVL